jgi:hypothetical protein
LINISHSESRGEGVVTVWYWVLWVDELEGRAHRVWPPNNKASQIALPAGFFTSWASVSLAHRQSFFPHSSVRPATKSDHTGRVAANSQIGAAAKNSQPKPATFLSEIVQYWTAIYPKLPDHQCRT